MHAKRMEVASNKFQKNVLKRGRATNKVMKKEESSSVGPWILGIFVFVVIGSAFVQIFRNVQIGQVE